jgi:hypothetical protein
MSHPYLPQAGSHRQCRRVRRPRRHHGRGTTRRLLAGAAARSFYDGRGLNVAPVLLLSLVLLAFLPPGPSFVYAQVGRCTQYAMFEPTNSTPGGSDTISNSLGSPQAGCPTDPTIKDGLPTLQDLICAFEEESINTIFRGNPFREGPPYVYRLCPDTVYTVTDNYYLTATLDGTVYTCGSSGARSDNCVVESGSFHVALWDNPHEVAELDDVRFKLRTVRFEGITFRGASVTSVYAAAGPDLTVEFVDCSWEESETAILQDYDTQQGRRTDRQLLRKPDARNGSGRSVPDGDDDGSEGGSSLLDSQRVRAYAALARTKLPDYMERAHLWSREATMEGPAAAVAAGSAGEPHVIFGRDARGESDGWRRRMQGDTGNQTGMNVILERCTIEVGLNSKRKCRTKQKGPFSPPSVSSIC